MFFSALI